MNKSNKLIVKNVLYNVLFQIVTLMMPLITVPYISRVLGTEGVGIYGYTSSIVQYFIIMGSLGIGLYGNRQIAYVRDDKEKMSNTFWSIYFLNFFTTGIAFIVYILSFGLRQTYGNVYIIQSINIIAAMIDISWLFMGLEDFKKTVTRNLAVKIIGAASVFIFVKTYDDLELYVIIYAMMTLLGNLSMWGYIPKTVNKMTFSIDGIKSHFIPTLQLFLPQVAIQVYAVLDKTMLGVLASESQVGLYEQSQKIIRLVLGIVTSVGVVMLPRMSNNFAKGDTSKIKVYLNNILKGVSYVSIPMVFGLSGVANEFVPLFFGEEFLDVRYLMIILAPILFFIALSNVLGMQYLMPTNKTKQFTFSVTGGAITNVIFNVLLIPIYKSVGACIATLLAEFTVTFIQYIFVRKDIESKQLFISVGKYIFSGAIMFIVVRFIGNAIGESIVTNVVQVIVGSIIYVLVLGIIREDINKIIFSTIYNKAKERLKTVLN